MVQRTHPAPVFRALAEPTRVALLERLAAGPHSLTELAAPLDMSLQAVRKHVNVLEGAGLLRSERRGKQRVCQLEPAPLMRTAGWLSSRAATWRRRLDRLQLLMEES